MTRALLVVGILVAMLVVPIWLRKGDDTPAAKAQKAEVVQNKVAASVSNLAPEPAPAAAEAPAAPVAPRPIGHGLTFAVAAPEPNAPPDAVHLSCHGEPRQLDQPHQNSCNPYKGDTSCRVVLPVLCFKPGGADVPAGVQPDFYKGWTGGTLSATQPLMGAILESEATASARCEKELGSGWRMAEFHDGQGGWGLQGLRGAGLGNTTRYWVRINDQKGNCWDSGA
jgi:hypothetical protein